MEEVIAAYTQADDRRHGADRLDRVALSSEAVVCNVDSPLASSIPALRKMVVAKMVENGAVEEEIKVPSDWLFGHQFLAPDSSKAAAERYTGRFALKHKVQVRAKPIFKSFNLIQFNSI